MTIVFVLSIILVSVAMILGSCVMMARYHDAREQWCRGKRRREEENRRLYPNDPRRWYEPDWY